MSNEPGGAAGESFGARIQQLRREHGITQRQVAAELGIDFTYLSKLENDRGEPPGEGTVRRLAQLFGVDPEELLAKAGKIPTELRERRATSSSRRYSGRCRGCRRTKLQRVYRSAGLPSDRARRRRA